jgi:hypothetical protein
VRHNRFVPSKARNAFDGSATDVKRLIEIHSDLGGDARGRRYRLEVLNKSAIVLITAIWEAYCEDIASEGLRHLLTFVAKPTDLPKELRKRIAAEIKSDQNELAAWDLAADGWKTRVENRLAALTAERNRKLNTPKAEQIDQLFMSALGIAKISDSWRWKSMTAARAREKLDRYVGLRGAIAHRGAAASSCTKFQVEDYFDHVKRVVSKTGGKVNTFVSEITSKPLW